MRPPEVWAILVAGGTGSRYGRGTSKLLAPLRCKPVIQHSAETLYASPEITGLVVVAHPDWAQGYQECLAGLGAEKPVYWAPAGETRRASVYQGLQLVPESAAIVLIHDAARPLVTPEKLRAVLTPVVFGQALGASLGLPSQNALKQVTPGETPWVIKSLMRETVWQVHTPQVFRKDVLIDAHRRAPQDALADDDLALLAHCYPNAHVAVMVPDNPGNLKITTPADLALAEAYLSSVLPLACKNIF